MISDKQFDLNQRICGVRVNKYDMMLLESGQHVQSAGDRDRGHHHDADQHDAPQRSSSSLFLTTSLLLVEKERTLPVMENKHMKKAHLKLGQERTMSLFLSPLSSSTKLRRGVQRGTAGGGNEYGVHSTRKRRDEDPQSFLPDSIFWSQKKSVTFPVGGLLEKYQEAPECYSTACVADLWYQPKDFARFRCSAQLEASAISWTEESSQCLDCLENSISIAARLAEEVCKYRKSGHREAVLWDRIFQRLDIRQIGVTQWCVQSNYRGLECLASKPLRRAKYSARKHMAREVSRQEDYLVVPPTTTAAPQRTQKRRSLSPEELANKLEQRSQFSRLFARMVGIADELSALQEYTIQEGTKNGCR